MDSGRNSANAMAPAEVREVEDRKRRLSAVFKVNAVRRDCIYGKRISRSLQEARRSEPTPSNVGPEQGFLLRSRVSRHELYF